MNNFLEFISPGIMQAIGWSLLHSLWQGLAVVLVLRLALSFIPSQKALLRYRLSSLALFGLLIWIGITATQYLGPAQLSEAPVQENVLVQPLEMNGDSFFVIRESQNQSLSLEQRISTYLPWVFIGWSLGALLFGLRLLGGWVYLLYISRFRQKPMPATWSRKVHKIAQSMGISRGIRLAQSELIRAPLTFGQFRPVILIPVGMLAGLTPDQVEAIFIHELAHIRRYDYLINFIQSLIEVVLFYHPAVWWISAQIRENREHCCDDIAIRQGYQNLDYAKAILEISKFHSPLKTQLAMSALGRNSSQLNRRIKRLFGHSAHSWRPGKGLVLALLLLGCSFSLAFNSWSEQHQPFEKEIHFTITPHISDYEVFNVISKIRSYNIPIKLEMLCNHIDEQGTRWVDHLAFRLNKKPEIHHYESFSSWTLRFIPGWEEDFRIETVGGTYWIEEGPEATKEEENPEEPLANTLVLSWEEDLDPTIYSLPIPLFVLDGVVLDRAPGEEIPPPLRAILVDNMLAMRHKDNRLVFIEMQGKRLVTLEGIQMASFDNELPIKSLIFIPPHEARPKYGQRGANGAVEFSTVDESSEDDFFGPGEDQPAKANNTKLWNLFDEPDEEPAEPGAALPGFFAQKPKVLINKHSLSYYGLDWNNVFVSDFPGELRLHPEMEECIVEMEVLKGEALYKHFGKDYPSESAILITTHEGFMKKYPANRFFEGVKIYDNPSQSEVVLEFTLHQIEQIDMNVRNIQGQIIKKVNLGMLGQGGHRMSWNYGQVAGGVYVVELIKSNEVYSEAIQIAH